MFGNIQGFGEKFFFISQGVWDGIKIAYNKNLEQGDISFLGVCVCIVAFVWGVYVMHVLGVYVCVWCMHLCIQTEARRGHWESWSVILCPVPL